LLNTLSKENHNLEAGMKLFYRISAYLLLIGVIHTALTPFFYDKFSPDALWFAGTGLALVFLSLLNIVTERSRADWMLKICVAANLAGLIYGVLIVVALPEIQAFISLAIFVAVTIGSIFALFESSAQNKVEAGV
jgi:hypothetical protein